MLSLVTVSPVITAFHSCCLTHHVFDQVNLWPAWVGFETAIFWQCSPGTVETQRLYPMRHRPKFWHSIASEHPLLSQKAVKMLLPFATAYLCEIAFSALTNMKTKYWSRLVAQSELHVSLSKISSRIDNVCDANTFLSGQILVRIFIKYFYRFNFSLYGDQRDFIFIYIEVSVVDPENIMGSRLQVWKPLLGINLPIVPVHVDNIFLT